jgi:putative ABC transport system substrate-binding protein
MRRRVFVSSVLALSMTRSVAALAASKPARIGWVTAQREASLVPFINSFREGLAQLGYSEGRDFVIDFRYGNDNADRVPGLASELVRLPVDLLVVQGEAVRVVAQLAPPVPMVYVFSGDPVAAGFAESLSRPRANMTGLTFMAAELNGKRLELLRELVPALRRVAIVANPEHPGENSERTYSEEAARRLGIGIDYFPTHTQQELTQAFATMTERPPQAISLFADGFAIQNRQRIIDFAMSQRAPVVSGWPVFAQSGALLTYGPRLTDSYRRLAHYVDRVLKGAKPADLPIERPTTFQLVVNVRTAKRLGIPVAESLLLRADDVLA